MPNALISYDLSAGDHNAASDALRKSGYFDGVKIANDVKRLPTTTFAKAFAAGTTATAIINEVHAVLTAAKATPSKIAVLINDQFGAWP